MGWVGQGSDQVMVGEFCTARVAYSYDKGIAEWAKIRDT